MSIAAILILAAFILFLLATFNVGTRFNLTAAGLACLAGSMLVPLLA